MKSQKPLWQWDGMMRRFNTKHGPVEISRHDDMIKARFTTTGLGSYYIRENERYVYHNKTLYHIDLNLAIYECIRQDTI